MNGLTTRFGTRGFNSLVLAATLFAMLLAWQGPRGFSQTGTGEINATVQARPQVSLAECLLPHQLDHRLVSIWCLFL
jgi:hypothetical protein